MTWSSKRFRLPLSLRIWDQNRSHDVSLLSSESKELVNLLQWLVDLVRFFLELYVPPGPTEREQDTAGISLLLPGCDRNQLSKRTYA